MSDSYTYRLGPVMEPANVSREEGLVVSWVPGGLLIELYHKKLESIKQKHEAEMASLRQQLEEHRQHSEDIHLQLQEQYLQAVSSLRDGLAQAQQQELDAVVGQLQELHQRQLQQLHAEHKYDTELEVMAVRVAVEQIQTARVRLMEEQHNQHVQRLKKEHKDQLNALRAEADRLHAGEGLIPPLSACEELTRQYQQLVQRINQSLERQVQTHVHEDHDPNKDKETVEGEETASADDVITPQQAKALQATLQAQQEEVLHLRSELLAEYDRLLQQRSAQAAQQTSDVLHLQEEMTALQQQYEQQIKEFQAHLNKKSELKEMQEPYEQADNIDSEQVKATYEQRIADMEDSFTRQIVALEQTALHIPDDAIDALTSKLAAYSSTENESPLPSQRLVFVKDYVHRSTFVDGTSNVDTDTTASSWGMYDHEDRRLQEFIKTMEEKNSQVEELERSLDRERQRTNDFVEELGISSQQLSKLAAELEEQKQVVQKMVVLLEEKDRQLQETQHKAAESEKLLREITEKEDRFQKEKGHEDGLHAMHESDIADSGLVTSPSSVEEEVRRMKTALDQATAALRAMEQRERRLQEQLEEFEHQHQEALEALRQEMEHEAQVERDSLQSEFQVQLEVEMRRQAAELQRQFVEQTARTMGITSDSCPASSRGEVLEEEGTVVRTAAETSAPPHIEAGDTVQETVVVQGVCLTLETLHSANRGMTSATLLSSGTQTEQAHVDVSQNLVGANYDSVKEQLKSDFDKQMEQLRQAHEAEKTRLAKTHLEEMKGLQDELLDAEEKYDRLKEVIEEHEGAGVDQLLKDRYDMELELAKSLMQKEFDDTLAAEKKKFVERHRQLMDGFMSEQEAEADKIKQQHQQNLSDLKSCLATMYMAIIADLQALLKDQKEALLVSEDDFLQVPSEKEKAKSQEEEKETDVKDAEDADLGREEESEDVVVQELHRLCQNLRELCHLVAKLTMKYDKAVTNLTLQHEARLSELKAEHQDQLEAAALDTDVLKSELELAHADLESLRQKLASQLTTRIPNPDQLDNEKTSASPSSREGDQTPDVRSSLEYEETDEEGSIHSFSSMLGKTRSFDNGSEVKTASPSQSEQRIKQLKAEIEQLTQQLEQQRISAHLHAPSPVTVSPPSVEAVASLGARRGSKESESVVAMLQSDLDRISAERDTIQQINNRLLQLLSDSIHTYVEVEDHINRRLHSIVSVSGARPQSPALPQHDGSDNFPARSGAGVAASSIVISRATGIMSSPRSDHGWQPGEADTSLTLEETSILSIATDEGLDMSQRLADSIFTGPDIGAEGEEIVGDARGRLQSAVGHLLDMIGQTTQQLMEAKITQTDLLESLAARSSENSTLAAHIQDLEEQLRQEVSAKEYFSLELHKAEGLIKGYSSEREMMEEEMQLLEEQKETLARDLETTRSQLQDFQDAAGELEARRQDVERHQMLLQQNAGQEAQESSMAGGDTNKSEEQALLAEVNTVKQERREQTLQLQHRLEQAQQSLHDREANLEELERALQHERDEMREQVQDLRLQLENAERQLKSNKQFLNDQMNERELEREEFQREIERLKQQLQDQDRQEGSYVSLHHEIQDLTEQLQVRMEREAVMHQKIQELQQTLQDSDLSAQDLRVWIATLETELDQRGDTEQQLKDHIHKLERQLTQDNGDAQSVESGSPVATCRPVSPGSADLSLRQPAMQPALSYVSLEEELKRSQQAKEELVHQKEALKHTVQEQLLQISALRNQLDDLRHWRGPPDTSASASTTADLRDELESEREAVQKKEEEIFQLKSTLENLEKQLAIKQRELEQLTDQFQKLQQTCVTSDQVAELQKERSSLKARVGELSAAHAFPPELLEEKNAEIDELRHQLCQKEVRLKEKDELISDLQDTVLSLQRGETCLDVSLPFNEPVSLNASFTERPPAVVERPTCLTTLAQELDQTASEQEGQIVELNSQVERLGQEVAQLKDQLQEAVAGRTALETELQQKDDDLSQLQEEKAQKQETLVEKDSRLEQLMVQVKSLQTEINNLTAFQVELQKDYDTVQNMLEEKEQEIESLTREYLEARSQPDGSDELEAALAVAQKKLREQGNVIEEKEEELYELRDQLEAMDSLKEELNTLTTRLAEKEAELQKEKNLLAEVQKELAGIQQAEHNQEQNTDHQLAAVARTLEEQISLLKAEVLHLEESVKDKEQLIKNLEEEKCAAAAEHEMELATMRNHLTATQDEVATKLSQLEMLLAHKEHSLQQVESLSDKKLHAKEQEATALREDLEKKNETIEKLEGDVLLLQQQVTERDSSIRDLHQRSRQQQDHLKGEITHLEEQLHHLSSTTENAATDEDKALQNELAQASDRIVDLEQQLVSTQSHLEEALTRVEEKENHVQQLQEEMRRLQLGAAEGQAEDFEQRVRVDSLSCLPESSEDTEVHDERLRDFLAKAEQMQMTVQESLSASLPMPSDAQRLSRWDSEPGLSSTYPAQLVTLTFGTETWMRRQQRELASKNRELALLREELEGWLKRKGRSQETLGSASTVLQLYEKESVIISLKRELAETKALLAAAEKRAAQSSESFVSMELSPQTKQQIAHLRSELRLAKAALAALQEHSQADGVSTNVGGEAKHVEQRELNDYDAQTQLHHSSATMCATDFVKKVQELREEIALEHQNHIRNIQEAARHDMEIKMTEMQARHDHEVQQLRSRHEQRLEQALAHQQQALEKQHKMELNSLCVQHQQEIERLRSEELASLTDAAITNRLRVDVRGTQQVEDGLIGSFHSRSDDGSRDDLSTVETSSVVSGSEEVLPPRLQALLNRLRQAGDHILSISELNFLLQHLAPQGEASSQTLVEAFESEKSSLVKATHALKELLSQADRVGCGLQEIEGDWRSELLHALVEVYKRERLTLESELYTLRLQHPSMATADIIKSFDNRLREQEQLQQSGLDAMLRAERQSLLAELEDLRSRLLRQRTEQQEQQARLSDALAKMEEQASSKEWKLQREVQVLEYKLQQEKVIQEDLQKRLEAERRHTTELSAELSRSKAALTLLQSELQSTHIQLSRARDALEREQHRFTSVTDALEEERQKNNRLAEMLETLRRQHHNLETERSRLEAIYKERETTENKVIKELRAELASQRENLRKTTESAEKERRDRQQALTAASEVQQANVALRQEVDKVQHQTKKVLEGEATKLQELQNKMKQDHVLVGELQGALEDRDSIIARLTQELSQLDDLQLQVQQLQKTMASSEQQLEKERKQVSHLTNILDKEREEHGAALQQELGQAKQLRSELSAMKAEASNVCHQLDLEKARAEGLHLDLERAQSELRVLTQHAGVTERQLEAEQTATWNRLRAVQHEKDELEIKVHQLELELERIQDKVQDLELELDRCCRRELEARHDVERHKLYPAVSPRMTSADGQTEVHDAQLQARLSTFIRQLQGVGERLHVLLLRQSNRSSTTDAAEEASRNHDGSSVGSLLQELQALRDKMFSRDQFDGGDSKQMVELDQLKTCLTTLTREKEELQRRLDLLENEDNIRTLRTSQTNTTISTSSSSSAKRQKQPPTMPQYVSDAASDDEFVYERTVWASERLSLQMALDSAEREIDHLKKELRHFRGRFDSEGFMVEADKNKMQRLYGKYLRAESFRKALVYQKKYLLLLLGGYQDSEQETLAIIATMGGQPSSTLDLAYRRRHRRLYTIFRSAARTVVAIFRMKYLVRKWKRATRVGSPIVSGRLNHHYGYVATTGSFTQPNFTDPDNHYSSPSATSSYVNTIMRGSPNGNVMSLPSHSAMSHIVGDGGGGGNPAGVRFSTPPTKEFTHTQRPSNSPLSTNARRHLLHILDAPQKQSGDATEDNGGFMGAIGGESVQTDNGVGDDFLQRLENLQTRLSSQNGPTMKRPAWR